jgi:hypothetical protein
MFDQLWHTAGLGVLLLTLIVRSVTTTRRRRLVIGIGLTKQERPRKRPKVTLRPEDATTDEDIAMEFVGDPFDRVTYELPLKVGILKGVGTTPSRPSGTGATVRRIVGVGVIIGVIVIVVATTGW